MFRILNGSRRQTAVRRFLTVCCLLSVFCCFGCTSVSEYIHNGFKVGPNYQEPPAPAATKWIDANDKRLSSASDDHTHWWTNFNDPVLNDLICDSYKQNLTLKEAGMRILQARATLGIAIGELFPQTQQATGDYTRTSFSKENVNSVFLPKRYASQFDFGFGLSWELDFWGRFRRAVESAEANLEASVFDYDDVLVTLLGDVATNYVNMRVAQKRIEYARANIELQRKTVDVVDVRFKGGAVNQLALAQAQALLYQTEATIFDLEITERQSANALCILMGIPPEDLQARLGKGSIPRAPAEVAVGVPADLLRRRPDVRRAERQAAAQSALIGVAVSDLYPHVFINGEIQRSAAQFKDVFNPLAYNGVIGPAFQWNILNYGRLLNNVKFQDARFKELVFAYQQTVLSAEQDVENGLVTFLKGRKRYEAQLKSVQAAETGVKIVVTQFEAGAVTIAQLILFEQNLVQQQDTLALAEGEISLGLIQAYRALGGGWQIRNEGCTTSICVPQPAILPAPKLLPPSDTVPADDMKGKLGAPK
jgi:NodT family efflux transporter outer membrane factor (OMF) lipoprotein